MANWYFCPRGCGKKLPKKDKMAEFLHLLTCKKSVHRGGLNHPFK